MGRYVVLEEIGAGGMGVVYSAYDPSLDRKVALKLLRFDQQTGVSYVEARARLVREAQAMARLSHPNVVAVHDAGIADGQVFIAMDYVHGETLRSWLRSAERSWREVAAMFGSAAQGLAAAHAAGIVHRDFKPANVIVGDDGRVQVTDFGLARQIAAAGPQREQPAARSGGGPLRSGQLDSHLTQAGVVFGTAGFIAPEQAEGMEVDARTDQYSFCVALHQALYGVAPFAGPLRVSTDDCPEPPSGSGVPRWLFRIVQRGLSYDREQRFPSMHALLAELDRDPTARRHRRILAAIGVAATVLVVAAVLALLQLRPQPCRNLDRRLAGIWDPVRKEEIHRSLTATGVPFAEGSWLAVERALDAYSERWVRMATDACAATRIRGEQSETLLDLRTDCLNQRLAAVDALGRVLAEADGAVAQRAAEAAFALPDLGPCADAARLLEVVRTPDEATAARVADLRQQLAGAVALEAAGRFGECRERLTPLMEAAATVGYAPLQAEVQNRRGSVLRGLGDAPAATDAYLAAAAAAEVGRDDRAAARAHLGVAAALAQSAFLDQAERWLRLARAKIARLGDDLALVADLANQSGILRSRQGRHEEALADHSRSLELCESLYGSDHLAVAAALNNLGVAYTDLRRYDDAQECYRRALEIREHSLGGDHPGLAPALINLGNVLAIGGLGDEAETCYRRALAVYEGAFGPSYRGNAIILTNLAGVVHSRDPEEGLALLGRALTIKRATMRPDHTSIAFTLLTRGNHLMLLGRNTEAAMDYREAVEIIESSVDEGHPGLARALTALGEAELALGRPGRALEALRRALVPGVGENRDPVDDAWTSFLLARALWQGPGDRAQALRLARESREVFAGAAPRAAADLATVTAWLEARSEAPHGWESE